MIINMEALGYPGAFCGFGRMANPDRVFFLSQTYGSQDLIQDVCCAVTKSNKPLDTSNWRG